MGSLFTIVGYGSDTGKASRIAMASFAMVDSLNLIMSDYNPESELMRLSRLSGNGKWIPVSDELYEIIRESLCWSRRTDGLFDITVGAYSQLWRRAGRKEKIPDTLMLNNAASVVGFKYIKLNKNKQAVKLTKPGIQLDLGGIAKGYTVDRIFELFRSNGFDAVLVDGGGDIRTGENPPGSRGWKIVIETQYSTDSIAYVENSAIATSGDLFRFTEINGIRYSHIINPRTGYGITIPRTVTVTAPDCTTADVLSSFLSISGPDKGFKSLDKLDGVDAIIVEIENGDKKIYRYSGR
ncbi:MAG: FAD:protein FMN transferase [Cyclobacteriaceae bacterium]|nr:FAD:protein FMN transferase [Cyclobacteriaceae bacterium]